MAKEPTKGLGIFAKTEDDQAPEAAAPGPAPLRAGKPGRKKKHDYQPEDVAPIGVGLTFEEGERLNDIAAELGVKRHALLLWLVRDFVRRWDAGERPPTETKSVLKR